MSIDLRLYQTLVIAEFQRCVERGDRSILLVAPTGSGKTVIGAAIINCAIALGHRVLVIAHRREIITQTRDKLVANGVKRLMLRRFSAAVATSRAGHHQQ